jgi:hypothetical protein
LAIAYKRKREPQKNQALLSFISSLRPIRLQSGDYFFVTTNNLLKQAKKIKKKSKYPFFPHFKPWTNQIAGWRIMTTNKLIAYASPKK